MRPSTHGLGRTAEAAVAIRSTSQYGARQAGGATAAVDAKFAAGEGADIESGVAKTGVGLMVFFDREQAITA